MPTRRDARGREWFLPCLAAALALHLLAATALLLLSHGRALEVEPETGLAVEIVTAQQLAAAMSSGPTQPPPAPARRPAERHAAPIRPDAVPLRQKAMLRAPKLLSAEILANARSGQAREALSHMAIDERIVQLCTIEAMEQVHRRYGAYEPDLLIAYAMADTKFVGRSLEANGAAFRSKHRWFGISFRCEVTSDAAKVAGFEFLVGAAIPRGAWESHGLADDAEPLD